jgi:ribosomal protein L11 methyltransferase
MDWIQLTLQTNKNQADFISEVLIGLGSVSVAFTDTKDDAIFEPRGRYAFMATRNYYCLI